MANPSLMGSVLARQPTIMDVADRPARLDVALDQPADAHRRRIRHARLHQRRPAGRRLSDRPADRRHDLQRRRAGRAARALSRGAGAGAQSVAARRRFLPGTASTTNCRWSTCGRGRSSSPIRRSGFQARAALPRWSSSLDRDDGFCHLSYHGAKNAYTLGDYFWDTAVKRGRDANPFRLGFLQMIAVSETDAAAEEYAPHIEYFFHNLLHQPRRITRPSPAIRIMPAWCMP